MHIKKIPKIEKNIPLKLHTTYKVGGIADFFAIAQSKEDIINLIRFAKEKDYPITIIGGGSNILVSDKGIRGLVIKNLYKEINILDTKADNIKIKNSDPRYQDGEYFEFSDLESEYIDYKKTLVNISSGVILQYLINDSLSKDLCGLEYFTAIPGTFGGAIFNNIHGGTKFIGDLLYTAEIIDINGNIQNVEKDFFDFSYDYSVLHKNRDILLSAKLILFKGDSDKSKENAKEWFKRKKSIQPILPSAGSVFRNLTNDEKEMLGAPVSSAGWVIEQCNLKGFKIGGAQVYEKHANWIVNLGFATQKDISQIIDVVQTTVYEKFKIQLLPEIIFKGEK